MDDWLERHDLLEFKRWVIRHEVAVVVLLVIVIAMVAAAVFHIHPIIADPTCHPDGC